MRTLAIPIRPIRTKVELRVRAECPLCGHTAFIVFIGGEKIVYCPDRYCPNCKDRHEE